MITDHEAYGAMMYGGMRAKEQEAMKKLWRENWVCFSPMHDAKEVDLMVEIMREEGIYQYWHTIYGNVRAILLSMGLNISKPHIFQGTKYIGSSVEDLKTHIYTMKRMHGEI
jgi:hypothetical protein